MKRCGLCSFLHFPSAKSFREDHVAGLELVLRPVGEDVAGDVVLAGHLLAEADAADELAGGAVEACALDAELKPVNEDINATQNVVKAIRDLKKDNEELPDDKKKDLEDNEKHLDELRKKKENIVVAYAAGESRVHQLIDIALLSNGMLKGEGLERFLKRSIGLLK